MGEMLGGLEQAVLLSLVRLRENAYGRTIHDDLQKRLGRSIARGALFVVLDRLESKGFVSSRLANPSPERGGQPKRWYSIESAGLEALTETRHVTKRLWSGFPWPRRA